MGNGKWDKIASEYLAFPCEFPMNQLLESMVLTMVYAIQSY
jgi:hypothetical protein